MQVKKYHNSSQGKKLQLIPVKKKTILLIIVKSTDQVNSELFASFFF